jgi:hypothetical protein
MDRTLTDRRNRHNLEITETAFGSDEGKSLPRHCLRQTRSVCAKKRSDEAIHVCACGAVDGLLRGGCHHCASAIALVAGAHSGEPLARNDDFNGGLQH